MGQQIASNSSTRAHWVRVILLFLPVAVFVCVGAFIIHQTELEQLHTAHSRQETETVLVGTASINRSLQMISRDLLYLASRSENSKSLEVDSPQRLGELTSEWVAFSHAHQVYDKIRWIDENGMERLRVNYAMPRPVVVAQGELQNKVDRYFFGETIKLERGEIFFSPLDLNVDNDQIELPHKPTIRLGMPVFDSKDNRRGIVVINYSASELLDRFSSSTSFAGRSDWLVNQEGFWLKGTAPEDEFGFMFGRDDLSLSRRFPDAWSRISTSETGQFETTDGLWTFATVHPLQEGHKSTNAGSGDRGYTWKTISLLPANEYYAGVALFDVTLGIGATLLLVLFFIAIWRLSRAQIAEQDVRDNLEHNEARLRSLIQTIPDLIWLKDNRGVYLLCNPAFERFFGAKESEIVGKTDYDFVHAELADLFRSNDRAAVAADKPRRNEEWITFADDGHHALIETTKVPVKTNDGQLIGVLGVAHDITERKRTENELLKSHYLLSNLTAHIPGVIYQFRLDPDGKASFPFIGDTVFDMYGLTPEQVYEDASTLFSCVHPEDIDNLNASIQKSAHSLQPWRHEYRTILPKRGLRWLLGNSLPEKHEDGSFIWYGFITDITERKVAEEGLQLATMVYQTSSEGILVSDADNRIIAVNPAFEQITGYTASEAIGKLPSILKSGRHDDLFYKSMWDSLNSIGHWQGELWNRRKDGSSYSAWLTINTIFNEAGVVNFYVALSSDITQKKESEKLIWQQANFDALTNLPNRNLFRDHLELNIRKSHRSGLPIALILLDLDHFKDVNDTLGHDMGDILLQDAAQRLRSCVRESDIVARLGGDEFTVILGELDDPSTVERVVQNILQKMAEPFQLNAEWVHLSASIGITFYPEDATEIEGLLKNADQAMYAAKKNGRNRSHYFDPSMQDAAQARMRLVSDLRSVLDGSQFLLHYQPIVELSTGLIYKAEALIRWNHPLRGMINPVDFIPAAEETGMIIDIGDWVFNEATKQAAHWRATHHPEFQISINISPKQFRSEGKMLPLWMRCLEKLGLSGQSIVVEITEGILLDATTNVSKDLLAFRDAGIQVAIDDFGTGYSSLAYLKKFDIDYIKIDQSFVANLEAGSDDMALCEAIIVMAHLLGMKVIAEGVETEMQRSLLASVNCDYAQGFLFSKPLSAIGLDALLQSLS